MFYCDEDAKRNNWPQTLVRSFGQCEVCGESTTCNDLPSSRLPKPWPSTEHRPVVERERMKINRTETIQSQSVYAPDATTAMNRLLLFCRELTRLSGDSLDDFTIGWEISSHPPNWVSFIATRNKT